MNMKIIMTCPLLKKDNPISFFLAHKKNRSFAALDEKGKVI